jgi:hypothetical protein
MPPHSFHLLQPLNIKCFSILKRAYNKEIEKIIRNRITRITKPDFFIAFHTAFYFAFTPENVRGGFRGARLVPLDPQKVIFQLDIKLRTPTPTRSPFFNADPWISKTPLNANEASQQSAFIRNRIVQHQNSSPTAIIRELEQITKGTMQVIYEVVLLKARVKELESANKALNKRRRAKKSRIRAGGPLNIYDAIDIITEKDVQKQLVEEIRVGNSRLKRTSADP